MTDLPEFSIIALTDSTYDVCRRSIQWLKDQTIADRVELLIVCGSRADLAPDELDFAPFHSVNIIELGRVQDTGSAIAAALREARGEFVTYVEEHNFFPPNLAEVVVDEMTRSGCAALGFGMVPANPGRIAWAHLFVQFAWAVAPRAAGPYHRLGGHHAAYRRDILLEFGDDLPALMGQEAVLHEHFRQRGLEMRFSDRIVVPHVQVSDFRTLLQHDFISQRIYANARMKTQNWSLARRLVYAAGFPLIPILRLSRILPEVRRAGRWDELMPGILWPMIATSISGAVGEATGYLFGASETASNERFEIEVHRYDYVTPEDRKSLPTTLDGPTSVNHSNARTLSNEAP